jgi:hypothetical protein
MIIEIELSTYRLLSQIAATRGVSANECAEEILSSFLQCVIHRNGQDVLQQLRQLGAFAPRTPEP